MSKFNFMLLLLFFRNHYDFLSEVCVLAFKFVHFKLFFILLFSYKVKLCVIFVFKLMFSF